MDRSREWCFNCTGELSKYVDLLKNHISLPESQLSYVLYARNDVASIPYLSGVLVCYRPQSKAYLERHLPGFYFSIPRVLRESILYIKFCEKDPVERGLSPLHPRELELEYFKEDVKNGMKDLRQIREKHSSVYGRFREFVYEYVNDHNPGFLDMDDDTVM
jgi:hypothetical protein